MRVLLDTSAYSALMRGDPQAADLVRRSDEVLVSTIVVGELLFGFRVGKRYEDNARQLDDFLDSRFVTLVQVTRTTADRFARIAAALRRKGRPIPVNDIWIAAQAMETGADLLSSDQHFEAVDGLALVRF
jgi:tRNA(fMet)-specific endonuclease VapC